MDYSQHGIKKRKKGSKQRLKKSRNKLGALIFRICLSLMIIIPFGAVGMLLGTYIGIVENTTTLENYRAVLPTDSISLVFDRHGNEIERFIGTENREFVTLDEIPIHMQQAIIAIEDERFFYHNGIDLRSVVRAAHQSLTGNTQGASTITQQLIKMSRGLQANDLESKLQEQYMAIRFEQMLIEQLGSREAAKYYILEAYLNSIPMHHNISGVQAAAHFYFGGKDISEITIAEAAVLAGITNRPTFYAPTINSENNRRRAGLVLDKMLELEFITQSEFDEAMLELETLYDRITQFRPSASGTITDGGQHIHSWFIDALIEQLIEDFMALGHTRQAAAHRVFNGGLRIYTTLDMEMQGIVDEVFLDDSFFPQRDFEIDVTYFISIRNDITGQMYHFEENTQVPNIYAKEAFLEEVREELLTANRTLIADRYVAHPQPQAAMVILDQHTGHVRAITGGRGEKTTNRAFCRATQATRQPGSVFKVPAAFAPALDLGLIGADTILRDEPFSIDMGGGEVYTPGNWWGSSWRGNVTARQAIYDSMNVVSVRTLYETGICNVFDYLLNFGFTTLVCGEWRHGRLFTDRGPALALGGLTDGVTQLEVTAAYAAMANGGIYKRPMFYSRIYDHEGNLVLYSDLERDSHIVLSSTTASLLTCMMGDTLTRGTGTQARFRNVRMPTAGKTGTSQNTRDLTFVGYTPWYTAGIWLGHDNDNFLTERGSPHLVIWRTVMERIHENLPYREFEELGEFVQLTICRDSGFRAVDGLCNRDIRGNRTFTTDMLTVDATGGRYCDIHVRVVIDSSTGFLADYSTPSWRQRTVIGIIVPDDSDIHYSHQIPASMAAGYSDVSVNPNAPREVMSAIGIGTTNTDTDTDTDRRRIGFMFRSPGEDEDDEGDVRGGTQEGEAFGENGYASVYTPSISFPRIQSPFFPNINNTQQQHEPPPSIGESWSNDDESLTSGTESLSNDGELPPSVGESWSNDDELPASGTEPPSSDDELSTSGNEPLPSDGESPSIADEMSDGTTRFRGLSTTSNNSYSDE